MCKRVKKSARENAKKQSPPVICAATIQHGEILK